MLGKRVVFAVRFANEFKVKFQGPAMLLIDNTPFWTAAPRVISIQRQSLGTQSLGSVPAAPTAKSGTGWRGSAPAALAAIVGRSREGFRQNDAC